MSFQPIVPLSGYVGWRFLQRTLDTQQAAFRDSTPIQRDTEYFKENIGTVQTANDLVSDRRLLSVALGAFGLGEDINNTFFIRTVLSDGTIDPDALSNRLSDKRYRALSSAMGLGAGSVPLTSLSSFSSDIIGRYEEKQFAEAIGENNADMRLALNVDSALNGIISDNQTQTGQWFSILGDAPLRSVFEAALGLPKSIGSIDLDRQLETFKERARDVLGTDDPSGFLPSEKQDDIIRLFLLRSEASQIAASVRGSAALTLLQSATPISLF